MSRSSIFSFDTLKLKPGVPRGLLVALCLLLGIELGAARTEWLWRWIPRSHTGIVPALESRVIAPAPDPVIVLLGSSRIRDAVAPRLLESELGLPAGTVLNLGLTGGGPYDALLMYRRNRDKLRFARLIVVGIEDRDFKAGFAPTERERQFATLSERLELFAGDERISLLAGYVFRTYDAKWPLRRFLKSLVRPAPRGFPIADDGRVIWRDQELETGPAAVNVRRRIEGIYRKFEEDQGAMRQFEELARMAKEDNAQVLLVQVPLRDAYIDYVMARYPGVYWRYLELARSVPGADVKIFERASELGIPENCFYDYGHLTIKGAGIFTKALADYLDRNYRGLLSTPVPPGPAP